MHTMGYFASFSDFLHMGGHGLYVWMSYGLTVTIFIWNIVMVLLKKRAFFTFAKRQVKREQRSL
jgi:heme exporter protein D